MSLAVSRSGEGPPVVLLHGLLGSGRNWGQVARALARDFHVVVPDLPNHGASPWSERMDYPVLVRAVAGLIEAEGAPVRLVGHSMGGKTAMLLALTRPDLVARLVVVDIAPVAYDHSFSPLIRAMRAAPLAGAGSRAAIEARLAESIPDPAVRALLMHNLDSGEGGFRWRPNLAALLAHMDDLIGFPPVADGRVYGGPTLVLAGERSDYVRPEHEARIRALFPVARLHTVAGAGHWVHADAPDLLIAALRQFFV